MTRFALVKGETDLAIANCERSLALNPDNGNAKEQLQKLRGGDTRLERPSTK